MREIRIVNELSFVFQYGWGALCLMHGGVQGFTWYYAVPGFFGWTYVNFVASICHMPFFGTRRYECGAAHKCHSVNINLFGIWGPLVLPMLGENWHNNHHAFASTARSGFEWWEIDLSYILICLLYYCGLVTSIRQPAKKVLVPYKEERHKDD